ncbi:CIS tube protein [Nostoc sp.]|uniref:CIS tube protein n=1 Tax=Nostoc sp. TaxID=1180 RepID=UPI002FF9DC3E
MLRNPFKLEKLKILVYPDEKRINSPQATFEAMFNPESYSLKYENVYQKYQGVNTSGRTAKYSLSKPQKLSLKLILDDTGVADYGLSGFATAAFLGKLKGTKDIYKQVNRFLQLTTYMDGKSHEPKFLKIEWGDLNFDCRLESVDVNYTLFNRSGQPIRAELETVFIGDIQDSKRIKQENKNSPDLSHAKTVKSGDKLPLMAQEIYGNSAYYIQLSRANNLNNFRKLKTGTTIKLPPIKEV